MIHFLKDARGCHVAYATHGSGPPLVCPPWWVSHVERDWDDPSFRAFFSELAERWTVIRYDRVGVGLSDRDRTDFDIESEVRTLEAVVDHLQLDRFGLFAISCGGPPAIAFTVRHPERVSELMLYGAFIDGQAIEEGHVRRALVALVRAKWRLGAHTLLDLFAPDLPRDDARRLNELLCEAADPEMAARLLELTFALDVRDSAPRIAVPTLVLHRRDDQTVPFAAGRELAARVPDATLVPLEGRAHVPWRDDSRSVIDEMVRFVGGSPRSAEPLSAGGSDKELVREGEVWRVTYLGRRAYVRHRKGLADLAVLLSHPGAEVQALDLMEGEVDAGRPQPTSGPVLDERAVQGYRQRMADLEAELARAEDDSDQARLEPLRAEREALLRELESATGLGGRRRSLGDPSERARKAVSARIRDGIAKIAEAHAELGAHLERSIETGLTCRYNPDTEARWKT